MTVPVRSYERRAPRTKPRELVRQQLALFAPKSEVDALRARVAELEAELALARRADPRDHEEAERARARSLRATVAGPAGEPFVRRAQRFVLEYLEANGAKSAEWLTLACREAGILPPTDDRAFGAVYHGLARRGLIVKVGTAKRTRGNGTTGGNVWQRAAR